MLELGYLAGISHNTYEHAIIVLDKAPEEVIQATRNHELSINLAYEVTKMPPEIQQYISRNIAQGTNPRKVILEAKKCLKKYDMKYWNSLIRNAEKASNEAPDIDYIINMLSKAIKLLKAAKQNKVK